MQEISYHLARWSNLAQEISQTSNPLNLPLEVMLKEAVRVACSLKKRWNAKGKVPGFKTLPNVSLSHADDILSLIRAAQEAQFLYYLEEESGPLEDEEPPPAKAKRLIKELRIPLEYLVGTLPQLEAERIKKFKDLPEHNQEDNASLSLLLRLYTEVASSVQLELATLGESFDLKLIQEAKKQMEVLNQLSEEATPKSSKGARNLYYQVLALLIEKVGKVRAAAGFLYRDHKKVLQEFTSTYERTRRRKAKQAASKKAKEK